MEVILAGWCDSLYFNTVFTPRCVTVHNYNLVAFRKVREFARDNFAVFDLLLDPLQGLRKTFGGTPSQDQGGSVFHDGLFRDTDALRLKGFIIIALRVDRMHQGLKDAFDTTFFPRIVFGSGQ